MLRLFVAVNLGTDVNARIAAAQALLKSENVVWVKPENFHVTVKFIGTVDEALVPKILAELTVCAQQLPFTLSARGVGTFRSSGRHVGVLWVGIQDPSGVLTALAKNLDARLLKLGVAAEKRPFAPHLTIGRSSRGGQSPDQKLKMPQEFADVDFGSTEVREITLYRSETLPSGAHYTRIAAIDGAGNVLT